MTQQQLTTLAERCDPIWTALVVIDMQNDFVSPDGAYDRTGEDISMAQRMLPKLVRLVEQARNHRVPVIFVRSIYTTPDNRYLSGAFLLQAKKHKKGRYFTVPVCAPDTSGAELASGLVARPEDTIVIKHRFSAFINTDLDLRLRSQGIRSLLITGVGTSVCVESTTRHAHFLDYYNLIVGDCCAAYSRDVHEQALQRMDIQYGQVVQSDQLVATWVAQRERAAATA